MCNNKQQRCTQTSQRNITEDVFVLVHGESLLHFYIEGNLDSPVNLKDCVFWDVGGNRSAAEKTESKLSHFTISNSLELIHNIRTDLIT